MFEAIIDAKLVDINHEFKGGVQFEDIWWGLPIVMETMSKFEVAVAEGYVFVGFSVI